MPKATPGCLALCCSSQRWTPSAFSSGCRTTNALTVRLCGPTTSETVVRSLRSPGSTATNVPASAPRRRRRARSGPLERAAASTAAFLRVRTPRAAADATRAHPGRPRAWPRRSASQPNSAACRTRTGRQRGASPRLGDQPTRARPRSRAGRARRSSTPETPSATAVRRPPTDAATTGVPHACDSIATRPNDSLYDGTTVTSAARYQSTRSDCCDRRREPDDVGDAELRGRAPRGGAGGPAPTRSVRRRRRRRARRAGAGARSSSCAAAAARRRVP